MMEAMIIMLVLIGLSFLIYFKIPADYLIKMPLSVGIGCFSELIYVYLMNPYFEIPTTPLIQLTFMVIEVIIFLFTSLEYQKIKRND